jgi:hypothetical protein
MRCFALRMILGRSNHRRDNARPCALECSLGNHGLPGHGTVVAAELVQQERLADQIGPYRVDAAAIRGGQGIAQQRRQVLRCLSAGA